MPLNKTDTINEFTEYIGKNTKASEEQLKTALNDLEEYCQDKYLDDNIELSDDKKAIYIHRKALKIFETETQISPLILEWVYSFTEVRLSHCSISISCLKFLHPNKYVHLKSLTLCNIVVHEQCINDICTLLKTNSGLTELHLLSSFEAINCTFGSMAETICDTLKSNTTLRKFSIYDYSDIVHLANLLKGNKFLTALTLNAYIEYNSEEFKIAFETNHSLKELYITLGMSDFDFFVDVLTNSNHSLTIVTPIEFGYFPHYYVDNPSYQKIQKLLSINNVFEMLNLQIKTEHAYLSEVKKLVLTGSQETTITEQIITHFEKKNLLEGIFSFFCKEYTEKPTTRFVFDTCLTKKLSSNIFAKSVIMELLTTSSELFLDEYANNKQKEVSHFFTILQIFFSKYGDMDIPSALSMYNEYYTFAKNEQEDTVEIIADTSQLTQ